MTQTNLSDLFREEEDRLLAARKAEREAELAAIARMTPQEREAASKAFEAKWAFLDDAAPTDEDEDEDEDEEEQA